MTQKSVTNTPETDCGIAGAPAASCGGDSNTGCTPTAVSTASAQNPAASSDDTACRTDNDYMELAIRLALLGTGHTSPNPLVGAVIVKNDRIIGQGYHARYGDLHAERAALAACTESPEGATIYVTLEPCCHHGKQPPCTDAILENGIKRVIIGSRDPNPLVSGKGARILREHGVEVIEDFMRQECDAINPIFFHYIQTGRPYVTLKYAMTMDGKIAAKTGESRWITGEKARENVHKDRNRHAAILVGIGTVLADDPLLNCRIEGGKDPVRVICDTKLRIPLDSQIVRTAKDIPTILAVGEDFLQGNWEQAVGSREFAAEGNAGTPAQVAATPAAPNRNNPEQVDPTSAIALETAASQPASTKDIPSRSAVPQVASIQAASTQGIKSRLISLPAVSTKLTALKAAGIRILPLPLRDGHLDLDALMEALGNEKIDSVLIEGGSQIAWSALSSGIINKIQTYIAPKIFGSQKAPGPVGGDGVDLPAEAFALGAPEITMLGDDILIESEVISCSQASSKK